MKKPKLHFRRFEYKYFISKEISDYLIPELLNYMEWDPYVGERDHYNCYSLYFDTDKYKSYHEKVDGLLNRKKVRIRSYTEDFGKSEKLFLELKRKSGDIILKDRALLSQLEFRSFMDNPFNLMDVEGLDQDFVNEYIFEITNYNMRPMSFVKYKRMPFVALQHGNFRVTFDYDIAFSEPTEALKSGIFYPWTENITVMEVKFDGSMPEWFSKLIQIFQLEKTESCKYCFGIDELKGSPDYQ